MRYRYIGPFASRLPYSLIKVSNKFMILYIYFFFVQNNHGIVLHRYLQDMGPAWRSRYTDRSGLGASRLRNPVVARDSSLLNTFTFRPLGPPSSPAMGAGALRALKRLGHGVGHPPPSRVQPYLRNRSSSRCPKWEIYNRYLRVFDTRRLESITLRARY